MAVLTPEQEKLLTEPNFAHVATLRPDGSPQVTVVWVDWDGENVLLNTTPDRAKARHLQRDPRVALDVVDRDSSYRYVEISGRAELVEEGAVDHIHALSRKYTGRPFTLGRGERRVIVRIAPDRVGGYGLAEDRTA